MKTFSLTLLCLFACLNVVSQDVFMQNGLVTQCSGTFYDSFGPGANYGSDENFVLTICPPASGDIIQLNFTAFSTQLGSDIMTIYDGDDISAPSLGTFSGGAVASPGLIRASDANSTGCLTIQWVSNASFNGPGWEADISCFTPCQTIVGSIDSTVPAFDAGSSMVNADIDEVITFNGSATFSSSGAGATYTWDFGDGTTATGPSVTHSYPASGVYIVTLTVTDTNPNGCSSAVEQISALIGASGPGNPFVDAGDDIVIDCADSCTDITANFLQIGETNTYTVSQIPFVPPFPFQGLTNSINTSIDDAWSPVENLPFDFCFFSNIETQFQVGSNGVIRFDVDPSDTGGGSNGYSFTQNLPNNSNPTLGEANVFTPCHDIDPSVNTSNEIRWEIIGTTPNRVLAVSFYNVPMYSCTALLATHMAVFYETTNVIDVYINNSPTCAFNSFSSVVGIQNDAGTTAFVPPGRNTSNSPWTATDEAWRFTPAGPSIIDFAWLDADGTVIGTTPTLNVCPTEPTTYTAQVIYTNCNGDVVILTDDVMVSKDVPFSVDLGPDQDFCEGDADVVLNGDIGSSTATYQWAFGGGDLIGETNPTLTVSSPDSGEYTVTVTDQSCSLSESVIITYFPNPVINPISDYILCDDTVVDGFTEFDLSTKDAEVIGGQTNVNISYHISQEDANSGDNPLPALFTNTEESQIIYVRIENSNNEPCYVTTTFQLIVSSGIVLVQPDDLEACDDLGNDGFAEFNLAAQTPILLGGLTDVTVSYHVSQDDANNNVAPLPSPYTNVVNPQIIYVRAQNDFNTLCFTSLTFSLNVNPVPMVTSVTSLEECDATGAGVAEFTLTDATSNILNGQTGIVVTYHTDLLNAQSGSGALADPYMNTSSPQTVYVRLENTSTGCYSTTTLELEVSPLPIANAPAILEQCDDDTDGLAEFNLTLLDAEIINGQTGVVVTYHLTQTAANNGTGALASPYTNTTADSQTIFARLENTSTGCYDTTALDLVVRSLPTSVPVSDYELCDENSPGDGRELFNLASKDAEVTGGQPNISVTYHIFQADAQSGAGALVSPYENTSSPQTIYAALTNTLTGCSSIASFDLVVNPLPLTEDPSPLEVCDDNVPDGLTAIDLRQKDAEVSGGAPQSVVSYHLTAAEAASGSGALPDTYTNISNPQTIYVRVEDSTTGCYDTVALELRVEQAPVAFDPAPLEYCDPDSDGIGVFTLTDADAMITGGAAGLVVTYHETPEEAQQNSNPQPSPYTNISPYMQTLYVRVESASIATSCATFVELQLVVLDTPQIASLAPLRVCDTDGDGLALFDLTDREADIYGTQSPADYTLTYHTDLTGAEMGTGAIVNVNAFANTSNPQTLYVRLTGANGCPKIAELELEVVLPPTSVAPTPLELCDDDTADQMVEFDLTEKDSEITGGNGSWSVRYYTTSADAQADDNVIDPATSYTNISVGGAAANPQTLYVRVTDTDTGCTDFTILTIRVLPRPTPLLDPLDMDLCDDTGPAGDGQEEFDLTDNETDIINGESGVVATYHVTPEDAQAGIAAIVDPTAYTNTNTDNTPQTIYVRVTNTTTGCYEVVDFDIRVGALPRAGAVSDYVICEVTTDGRAQFNLASRDTEALDGQAPSAYTVTYHATQSGADNLTGALISPYTNTINPQRIYVAITDNVTGCSISTPSFEIRVDDGAEANSDMAPIEQVVCDGLGDNDGLGQFDLTENDPEVLDGQSPMDFTVTYYATAAAAELGTDPIPYTYENISNPQVIYARVDNDIQDASGMDSSGCYDVSPLTLRVELRPFIGLEDSYTLCVGTNGTEAIGPPVLDTGLDATDYSFVWSVGGTEIIGATGPVLFPTQGGSYSVVVTDLATGCTETGVTEVEESSPPAVAVEVVTQAFSEDHTIVAEATGDGEYEYSLDGGPWQPSGTFEGVGFGLHTVTARDTNGCGEDSGTVTVLDYPHFFTPNGDGRNETWNIVGFAGQANAKIYIFDRFGKLLKQISPSGAGWNGTYNGSPVPTSDYWFTAEYSEPSTGEQKQFRAHFTLKR